MSQMFLEIAELASRADISSLCTILSSNSDNAPQEMILGLLLYFLPETLPVYHYQSVISQISKFQKIVNFTLSDPEMELFDHISPKLSSFGWSYTHRLKCETNHLDIPLSNFAKCLIRIIDNARRELLSIDDLFLDSLNVSKQLRDWETSYVKVLWKFRQFYSDHNQPWIPFRYFEAASPDRVIRFLLQYTTNDNVCRDMECLVLPYLSYNKSYEELWKWIGSAPNSLKHLELLEYLIKGGILKSEVALPFSKSVIAAIYLHSGVTDASFNQLSKIQKQLTVICDNTDYKNNDINFNQVPLFEELWGSPLTDPSKASLDLLDNLLAAAILLNIPIMELALANNEEEDQKNLVKKYIFGTNEHWKRYSSDTWNEYWESVEWIKHKVFHKLQDAWISETFLNAALSAGQFEFVKAHFSLSSKEIIFTVLKAFYIFYDTASNGNKTRGQMKKAWECLQLITVSDEDIFNAKQLVLGTHALSKYSLHFARGINVTPKEIRAYPDCMELIHRVLELNEKAYLEMDNLVRITENLLLGTGQKTCDYKNAIRKMCIEAALVDSNFEISYEYGTPYLMEREMHSEDFIENGSGREEIETWASLFQIGKFISPFWEIDNITEDVMEKKMRALSYSLKLCPEDQISSVLFVWQTLEKQKQKKAKTNSHVIRPTTVVGKTETSFTQDTSRKRDQLSNMLVSGLGWAIGASKSG